MYRMLYSKFIKLITVIIFLFFIPKVVFASDYITRGYFVIDLKNKIEWLTCPVGMVWKGNTCSGTAKKFELKFELKWFGSSFRSGSYVKGAFLR